MKSVRTKNINVKVSEQEFQTLKEIRYRTGKTISAIIRESIFIHYFTNK